MRQGNRPAYDSLNWVVARAIDLAGNMNTEAVIVADDRIDLNFALQGTGLPRDHGYPLFAALCRVVPDLHGAAWLAIHPVRGEPDGDQLRLVGGQGTLSLRMPVTDIARVLPLADQILDVHGHRLRLGPPTIQRLHPHPTLECRLAVIKGATDEQLFRDAVGRQLSRLGVCARVEQLRRRIININGHLVVGYGLRLYDLTARGSLLIQRCGIGGRQRMGCGVFSGAA